MRGRLRWTHATVALAVIGALAIAAPALGGPSLKKLVKNEVAKQIAKATGPAGPAGPSGATGATGAQGPGAARLEFSAPETDNTIRTIATVNELTVVARCGPSAPLTDLVLGVHSSVGGAEIEGTEGVSDNDSIVAPKKPIAYFVSTSSPTFIVEVEPQVLAGFRKDFVQATFFTSSRVISLQVYAVANDGNGTCQVHGTAVPAG